MILFYYNCSVKSFNYPHIFFYKVTTQWRQRIPEFEVFAGARGPRKHLKFGVFSHQPE